MFDLRLDVGWSYVIELNHMIAYCDLFLCSSRHLPRKIYMNNLHMIGFLPSLLRMGVLVILPVLSVISGACMQMGTTLGL